MDLDGEEFFPLNFRPDGFNKNNSIARITIMFNCDLDGEGSCLPRHLLPVALPPHRNRAFVLNCALFFVSHKATIA